MLNNCSFPSCPEAPLSQSDPKYPGNNPKSPSHGCKRHSSYPAPGVFIALPPQTHSRDVIPEGCFRDDPCLEFCFLSKQRTLTSCGTGIQINFMPIPPQTTAFLVNKYFPVYPGGGIWAAARHFPSAPGRYWHFPVPRLPRGQDPTESRGRRGNRELSQLRESRGCRALMAFQLQTPAQRAEPAVGGESCPRSGHPRL